MGSVLSLWLYPYYERFTAISAPHVNSFLIAFPLSTVLHKLSIFFLLLVAFDLKDHCIPSSKTKDIEYMQLSLKTLKDQQLSRAWQS